MKKEWVLNGDSVNYLNWEDLRRAIDYDLEQERNFSYAGLIHAFGEGNTRPTAVFAILYVSNNLFADHSWHFRNALVRVNYKKAQKVIDYTSIYLERFFGICCWETNRTCAIVIFILLLPLNGRINLTWQKP
ncbi:hypothetical protein [Phocaeicola sp.]